MLQEEDFELADVIRDANGCHVIQVGEWTTRLLDQLGKKAELSPDQLVASFSRLRTARITRMVVWRVIFAGSLWIRDNGEFSPCFIEEGPLDADVLLLDADALERHRQQAKEKVYAKSH